MNIYHAMFILCSRFVYVSVLFAVHLLCDILQRGYRMLCCDCANRMKVKQTYKYKAFNPLALRSFCVNPYVPARVGAATQMRVSLGFTVFRYPFRGNQYQHKLQFFSHLSFLLLLVLLMCMPHVVHLSSPIHANVFVANYLFLYLYSFFSIFCFLGLVANTLSSMCTRTSLQIPISLWNYLAVERSHLFSHSPPPISLHSFFHSFISSVFFFFLL